MYNYSGLWFDFYNTCACFCLVAIGYIFLKPWKKGIKSWTMIEATLALLVVVCMVLSSVLGILAPDIVTETVTYKYYNSCGIMAQRYVVQHSDGSKDGLYLDAISKKKIFPNYPDELEKNSRYEISYERRSRIIVRIEKVDDG